MSYFRIIRSRFRTCTPRGYSLGGWGGGAGRNNKQNGGCLTTWLEPGEHDRNTKQNGGCLTAWLDPGEHARNTKQNGGCLTTRIKHVGWKKQQAKWRMSHHTDKACAWAGRNNKQNGRCLTTWIKQVGWNKQTAEMIRVGLSV